MNRFLTGITCDECYLSDWGGLYNFKRCIKWRNTTWDSHKMTFWIIWCHIKSALCNTRGGVGEFILSATQTPSIGIVRHLLRVVVTIPPDGASVMIRRAHAKNHRSNHVRAKKLPRDHVRSKKYRSDHVRSKKYRTDHVRAEGYMVVIIPVDGACSACELHCILITSLLCRLQII